MLYGEITSTVKKSEDTLTLYSNVPSQLQLTEAIDQLKVPICTSYYTESKIFGIIANFVTISQLVVGIQFQSEIVWAGL